MEEKCGLCNRPIDLAALHGPTLCAGTANAPRLTPEERAEIVHRRIAGASVDPVAVAFIASAIREAEETASQPPKVPDHLCLVRDAATGRVSCDLTRFKGTRTGLLSMVSRLSLLAPEERQRAVDHINCVFDDLAISSTESTAH